MKHENREYERLSEIVRKLGDIVETSGVDKGCVLLSEDSPTHPETMPDGKVIEVYDHENFSPLGDALVELFEIAAGLPLRWYTWDQVSRDLWIGDLWWYDNGESIFPVNIAWCPTGQHFFATVGQWGWTRSQTLQEMGGRWRPCIEPEPDHGYRNGGAE